MTFPSDIPYLAVDPGWNDTGWCLWWKGRVHLSGEIKIWGNDGDRLYRLSAYIRAIVSKTSARFCAVELPPVGAKHRAVREVAGARYAVLIGCHGTAYFNVPVPTWKSTFGRDISGLKGTDSRQYRQRVEEICGAKPSSDNVADAMAIAWCVDKWLAGDVRLAGAKAFVEKLEEAWLKNGKK